MSPFGVRRSCEARLIPEPHWLTKHLASVSEFAKRILDYLFIHSVTAASKM